MICKKVRPEYYLSITQLQLLPNLITSQSDLDAVVNPPTP